MKDWPKVTQEEKQKIADQIVNLINSINIMMHQKTVDTFDLKEIRQLVKEKCDRYEIDQFKNVFHQIWTVWRDS